MLAKAALARENPRRICFQRTMKIDLNHQTRPSNWKSLFGSSLPTALTSSVPHALITRIPE